MRLEQIKLSYPVLIGDVKISYFTERKQTAIEWLILEIIKKTEENYEYANATLDEILQNIFFINDTEHLVHPCIEELKRMRLIKVEGRNLQKVRCKNCHLTDDGENFRDKGSLPGVENEVTQRFYLDVANDTITASKTKTLKQPQGIEMLSDEGVDDGAFISEVRDFLELAKGKKQVQLGWLESGTQIGEVIPQNEPSLEWINKNETVTLESDMNLKLPNIAPKFANAILDKLSAADDSKIDFFDQDNLTEISVENPDAEFNDIIATSDIISNINNRVKNQKIAIISSKLRKHIQTPTQLCKIICIDDLCEQVEINAEDNIIKLRVPKCKGIESIYIDSSFELFCGKFKMFYNDLEIDKIYGYSLRSHKSELKDKIKLLVEANYISNPNILVLLSEIKQSPEEYLRKVLNMHVNDSAEAISEMLESFDDASKKYTGKNYFNESNLSNILPQRYDFKVEKNISIDEFIERLKSWRKNWIVKKLPSTLNETILKYIDDMDNPILAEVHAIFKYLQDNERKTMQEIISKKIYLKLYTGLVLKQLFLNYNEESFLSTPDTTPIDHGFQKLKRTERQLQDHIYPVEWSTAINKEVICTHVLTHQEKISVLKDDLESWSASIKTLHDLIPEIDMLKPSDGKFVESEKIIAKIKEVVDFLGESPKDKYKKVYIVDTCALINEPKIISSFTNNKALLVVPMTVLEELDRHKENRQDQELQYQARQVIKLLESHNDAEWLDKNEAANMELLPQDYEKKSGDNKILSTALKFLMKKPTIISDDINFKNKAESLRFTTISSKDFCKEKGIV